MFIFCIAFVFFSLGCYESVIRTNAVDVCDASRLYQYVDCDVKSRLSDT